MSLGQFAQPSRGGVSLVLATALLVSPRISFAAPAESEAADPADPAAPTEAEPESAEPEAGAEQRAEAEPAGEVMPPEPTDAELNELRTLPPGIPQLDDEIDSDDSDDIDDEDIDDDESDGFEDDYDILRDSPEGRTALRWRNAGIAATVTGAVLVGGAIAFGLTDPCNPDAGNNCFEDARDRAALTMGAPGGVLLLGGVAMTVVGVLQRRQLRRNVAVLPTGTGVLLVGRF